jgi:hypothetical protein
MFRHRFLSKAILLLISLCGLHNLSHSVEVGDARAIGHLLQFVRESGCQFKRNGSWHDSAGAADHIERKFNYVKKRSKINSAEDFIRYVASESSWTGVDYVVKCPQQDEQTSSDWLSSELARYRSVN